MRADPDLRLLAGDFLYALGLERLAAHGDLEAVRELADLISLSAQLHAEDGGGEEAPTAKALWLASATAVGTGGSGAHERAKEALRNGGDGATELLAAAASEMALGAGIQDASGARIRGDRLRRRAPLGPWLTRGTTSSGAPRRLEKPEPPGYFEGETMTRRGVFAAGVAAARRGSPAR